jgi:hypothetical protein
MTGDKTPGQICFEARETSFGALHPEAEQRTWEWLSHEERAHEEAGAGAVLHGVFAQKRIVLVALDDREIAAFHTFA